MSLTLRPSKILLLGIFLVTVFFSAAQTRFALFAGAHAVMADYKVRGVKQNTDFKPGFLIGVNSKIEFENKLYFSPSLFYSYKGYKVTLNQAAYPPDLEAIKNDISVHALEISTLLEYDFTHNPSHFFVKFGPAVEMLLAGREKTLLINGNTVSRSMKFGFTAYGRYAASAVIQFGYKLKNDFFLQVHYAHGLSNLNNADAGPSIKYRIAGLSIGKFLK